MSTSSNITAAILRVGYDFSRKVQINKDGSAESLTNATIKATLKSADKLTELIADVPQSPSSPGASWANGLVVIAFSAATTSGLSVVASPIGRVAAWIEVSIELSGVRLPTNDLPVIIEKGWAGP